MGLWSAWVSLLSSFISLLSHHLGVTEAVAIILATAIARLALLPISLKAAYQGELNRRTLERVSPELQRLRESLKGDRAALATQTMLLYQAHGVNPLGRWMFLNTGTQAAFGTGMFQLLTKATFASRFLWIANLSKPDAWLAALVTVLMILGMALMPGLDTETSTMVILAMPIVVAVIAVATMPASVGIYWATSNASTLVQTILLRLILPRPALVRARPQ